MKFAYLLMGFGLFFFSSCGGDSQTAEEKAAEEISKATEGLAETLGGAAKDVEGGLAGALSQLESAVEDLSDEKVAKKKPLNFRKLKEILPESASGFTKTKTSGESTGMAGFSISTAKAKYENEDKKIDVEVIDAGGVGMAMMGLAGWSMIEIDKESDDGFERTTTYEGNKAFEKCRKTRCEFSIFVANRFVVTTKGRNVEIEDLHNIVNAIGIKTLEGMKDQEG